MTAATAARRLGAVFAALAAAAPAAAQEARARPGGSVAQRVLASRGEVRLAFEAREDVCSDGNGSIRTGGRHIRVERGGAGGWCACVEGPVRVTLWVEDGRVTRNRVRVGGAWPAAAAGVTDLGQLAPAAGAATLLELARRGGGSADDLVFPATLAAQVEVWPALLDLAHDRTAPAAARRAAIFWLSQEAGERATRGLAELVDDDGEDRDLREHAVFALSQLPAEEGVPVLLRVARGHRDPAIRRRAMFWLGQSDDPRALALFEELLTRPR
jgi:hypothetical protein